jgi:hypothetical protein
MSNYLYNLVARSFNQIETAQPRATSIFEPPRAFRPIDARQTAAPPAEEVAPAFDEDERAWPISSARVQAAAPSQTAQPSALDNLFSTDAPAVSSKAERPATHQADVRRRPLSFIEAAHEEEGEPTQTTSAINPQSERRPATVAQPSLQRETQPRIQPGPAPPTSTLPDAPITKSDAPATAQTVHAHERVMIEPLSRDGENPADASPKRQSHAEAKTRTDESSRQRAMLEQRSPVIGRAAEQRFVESALSTERLSAPLKNEPSINQWTRSLLQRMRVAAFDSPSQQAAESVRQLETKRGTQQRPETIIVQPQISRAVETQRPDALQQTRASEPEQIVQVTIGRIEVRAASPPAKAGAKQRSAQQPSQSLEEYLRKRAQGGGR